MLVEQVRECPRLVLKQVCPGHADTLRQSPGDRAESTALELLHHWIEQPPIARSLSNPEGGYETIGIVDQPFHDQQNSGDAIALFRELLRQNVTRGGHLRGNRHRVIRENAAVVMLVRHHLDALVDLQPLENLARLSTEFVAQEDVAAMIPVEAVLGEPVRVTSDPLVLLSHQHPQPALSERRCAGKSRRAGANHDDVVALVGHWRPRAGTGKKNGVRLR